MRKMFLSILLIFMLSACSINIKDFDYIAEDGYFLMDKNGLVSKEFDTNNKLIITLYLEPTSYTNIKLLDETFETIEILKNNEDVLIRYVPLMFLNHQYDNNLSSELGSLLLTLAEYDHDLLNHYLSKLRNKEYVLENSKVNEPAKEFIKEDYEKYKEVMLEPLVNGTQIYLNQNDQPIVRLSYNQEHLDVEFSRFDNCEKQLIKTIYEFDKLNDKELVSMFPKVLEGKDSQ